MLKILLIIFFCSCPISITAQIKPPVTRTSSPIFEQLNKEDIEQAEIWLLNKGDSSSDLELTKVPRQRIHLQKGLSMETIQNCSLKLENKTGVILYASLSDDNNWNYKKIHDFFYDLYSQRRPSYLELYLPLYDLSYEKGKPPHRLSKNPEKPGYNKWLVQIKAKGDLPISLTATYERRTEEIDGEIVTFVFDDEVGARQFDSDFRNAIRICKDFEPERSPKENVRSPG